MRQSLPKEVLICMATEHEKVERERVVDQNWWTPWSCQLIEKGNRLVKQAILLRLGVNPSLFVCL